MLSPARLSTSTAIDAPPRRENAWATASALSGDGIPRLPMSSLLSILMRLRESRAQRAKLSSEHIIELIEVDLAVSNSSRRFQ